MPQSILNSGSDFCLTNRVSFFKFKSKGDLINILIRDFLLPTANAKQNDSICDMIFY